MAKVNIDKIIIQGRVSAVARKKLGIGPVKNHKHIWLFIDYSQIDILKQTKFNFIMSSENKPIIHPSSYSVKILSILDEYKNDLSLIAKGDKTICKFEFSPNIPSVIRNLPLLNYWKSGSKSVILSNLESMIAADENEKYMSLMEIFISDLFTSEFIKQYNKSRDKINLYKYLISQNKKLNKEHFNDLLSILIQTGRAITKDDKIELLEAS